MKRVLDGVLDLKGCMQRDSPFPRFIIKVFFLKFFSRKAPFFDIYSRKEKKG